MPEIRTTLVSHEPKSGTGQKGPWTLHIFKDAAGQSYKTFEAPIGNRAYGLLNLPAVLTYTEKPAKDPQYPPDRVIQDVQQDLSFPAAPVAPVAPQAAPALPPTVNLPTIWQNAPTTPANPVGGGDDRQVQIMRQSALERAIRARVGLDYGSEELGLYQLSEEFLHYFQTGEYPGKSNEQAVGAVAPSGSEAAVVDEFADVFPQ